MSNTIIAKKTVTITIRHVDQNIKTTNKCSLKLLKFRELFFSNVLRLGACSDIRTRPLTFPSIEMLSH